MKDEALDQRAIFRLHSFASGDSRPSAGVRCRVSGARGRNLLPNTRHPIPDTHVGVASSAICTIDLPHIWCKSDRHGASRGMYCIIYRACRCRRHIAPLRIASHISAGTSIANEPRRPSLPSPHHRAAGAPMTYCAHRPWPTRAQACSVQRATRVRRSARATPHAPWRTHAYGHCGAVQGSAVAAEAAPCAERWGVKRPRAAAARTARALRAVW